MKKKLLIKEIKEFAKNGFEGYGIKLGDASTIYIGISNTQDCCEDWGYLTSDEQFSYYKGAYLVDIKRVDYSLRKMGFDMSLDEGEAMFVDVETSRGVFTLAVYNSHNGYYGHSVKIWTEGSENPVIEPWEGSL